MDKSTNDPTAWTPHGSTADLCVGIFRGRVDTHHPNAGIHSASLDGAAHAAKLLCVYRSDRATDPPWPLPLGESYVRGNDLVASYQPVEEWPFVSQLYWRANSLRDVEGVMASVSLLVSVQTHLLDTVPQIAVASHLKRDESYVLSARSPVCDAVAIQANHEQPATSEDCCIVSRLRDLPLSYVEIMPAGDFHAVNLGKEKSEAACEWRLFAEFLEKGVIRRARVHAAIVPRDRDLEIAAACCQAIDQLELPLTT